MWSCRKAPGGGEPRNQNASGEQRVSVDTTNAMAIEHPPPTTATVKLLYAHAFGCARPGCNVPLYREDQESDAWTLNSRICHINARSEGGPRWDPSQSPEDNRAESNLLLMCLEHASAIDDRKALAAYPAKLLREWKQAQIEDHRRRREGWPLTAAMADQAITASFFHVGIAINQSNIHLAGGGGNAPGAGGGGGGAIGHGARAGDAGKGGDHYSFGFDLSSPPNDMEASLRQAGVSIERPPGAGGGGAGAIGDNAIAGDGGDGGNGASFSMAAVPGDIFDVEIGEGGKGSILPGQHAQDGGDTVLRIRSPDGTLKQAIRIKGGAGPKAGKLPDGVLEISQADLDGGFQISTLMLLNAAELRDELLFILGGGWSKYYVPALPFDVAWSVLCTATWGILDPSADRGLQLCVLDPQEVEVSRIALVLPSPASSETNRHWLGAIGAPLNSEGRWKVRVQSGEFLLSQVEVGVVVVPSATPDAQQPIRTAGTSRDRPATD